MVFFFIVVHIAIAVWLMWFFVKGDKGNPEPIWAIVVAGMLGILSAVLAIIGNEIFANRFFDAAQQTHDLVTAWSGGWRVGVIEELSKALPVGLFIYSRTFFDEHADGVIYFGIAGLVFGALENILYTATLGAGLLRLIMTPFFHGASMSFFGYFVARAKLKTSPPWHAIAALALMMFLHGFYDACSLAAATHPWLILFVLGISLTATIGIFFVYRKARQADYRLGLAQAGVRKFCRHCGAPNPRQHLYCARCGQRA